MKSTWLVLPALAIGCGPIVVLPAGTDGGDGSTTGEPGSTAGVSTEGPRTDGSGDDGPQTTTPTTATPTTTGFGSTGFGSTTGPPTTTCWSSTPLFEVPEEARIFTVDQDGNGDEELWIAFFNGDGPGGSADLFWVSEGGKPIFAGSFPGFLTGLHDIDGDGVRDALGFIFDGGAPDLVFVPGLPGFIEGEPILTSLGFGGGFLAFHDATGDGVADFFANDEGNMTTSLLVGDGMGNFAGTPSMPAPFVGDMSAMATDDPSMVILAQADFFDPPGECVEHPFTGVLVNDDALLGVFDAVSEPELVTSAPLKAEGNAAFGTVYARSCRPRNGNVALQVTSYSGPRTEVTWFVDSTFVSIGDFDGDGTDDAAFGNLDGGVELRSGLGGGEFDQPTFDDAPYDPPVANRVYAVDIDIDGRDEIIVGTRDGGSEIVYVRLDLDDC